MKLTEQEIKDLCMDTEDPNLLMRKLFNEDVDSYGRPYKLMFKINQIYNRAVSEGFMDAMCK